MINFNHYFIVRADTENGKMKPYLWLCLCCRREPAVLVAGPRRRQKELLGRLPAWSAAVLLQPGGELHGHELLLQLWRWHRHVVSLLHGACYCMEHLQNKKPLFCSFVSNWISHFVLSDEHISRETFCWNQSTEGNLTISQRKLLLNALFTIHGSSLVCLASYSNWIKQYGWI